jgi:hypothetical protein
MTDKPEATQADSGALAALEAKLSTKASDGGAPRSIKRRQGTVTVPMSVCEPDTFDGPVTIGLEGINAATELEAMKAASDGASAGFAMARRGMRTLNGAPMRKHQADLVWECLGFAGRAMVVSAYLVQCAGAGDADLGKSLGSMED